MTGTNNPRAPDGAPAGALEGGHRRWLDTRATREREVFHGAGLPYREHLYRKILSLAGWVFKITGLYRRGIRNALDIRLNRIEIPLAGLPRAFDGYRILHISDLHFGSLAGLGERVLGLVEKVECDLCVMTGDYTEEWGAAPEKGIADLERLTGVISPPDGIVAVLGNHDSGRLVEPLRRLGVTVLVNDGMDIRRGEDRLHLTGTDDVHYFFSPDAEAALAAAPDGFKIALVHSPEIAGLAARAGYALYLTGHTHGGQVCLPGGRPVITKIRRHRAYAKGLWRCGGMVGYTNSGAGVSALPLRFNSPGEVALIVLGRKPV